MCDCCEVAFADYFHTWDGKILQMWGFVVVRRQTNKHKGHGGNMAS